MRQASIEPHLVRTCRMAGSKPARFLLGGRFVPTIPDLELHTPPPGGGWRANGLLAPVDRSSRGRPPAVAQPGSQSVLPLVWARLV